MFDTEALLLGGAIGLTSSIIGAIIDYRVLQRRRASENAGIPGCIFIVSGTLGLLGVCVIGASLFLQSLSRAFAAGLGVLLGFFGGFILMMAVWLLMQRQKSK